MISHRLFVFAITALAGAALSIAALGFTGTAAASPDDQEFLRHLTEAEYWWIDPKQTIAAAQEVCRAFDEGRPEDEVAQFLVAERSVADIASARLLISEAAGHYCPAYSWTHG